MRAIPIQTPHFDFDGRGPTLRRWIHDGDLYLPDSTEGFAPPSGTTCGAVYDGPDGARRFVLFLNMQVFQLVPHEVHSYWHRRFAPSPRGDGAYEIEGSPWLASFAQRHLHGQKHFVLEWYDELVEIICRELLFGQGDFEISRVLPLEPRLGYAYLRHALSQEKRGNLATAIESLQRYIACAPHVGSVEYAERCLAALRAKQGTS